MAEDTGYVLYWAWQDIRSELKRKQVEIENLQEKILRWQVKEELAHDTYRKWLMQQDPNELCKGTD
jgi:hypothetical protein